MKILITGGHPATALAVIDKIKKDNELLYLGRKYILDDKKSYSFEYKEIIKRNIDFVDFSSGKFNRHSFVTTLFESYKIPLALKAAISIINKFNPDVILSFGGFISVPVCYAGYLKKIPIIIHEQTFYSGLANKLTSSVASKICISWESSFDNFPKSKTVLTGLPLREKILEIKRNNIENTIYITGGSLGSSFLNQIVFDNLEFLTTHSNIIHQTGSFNDSYYFNNISNKWDSIKKSCEYNYMPIKHLSDQELSQVYKKSKLVICRSGINTVSELIYLNIPSIFIPLGSGQKNEQLVNALKSKELGLSEIIEQDYYSDQVFVSTLTNMLGSLSTYKITDQMYKIMLKNATSKIVSEINETKNK